jgi:tetratricopeptide (TPR) repeat protein
MALFAGGLISSVALLFGSAFAISQTSIAALQHKPVEWWTVAAMVVLTVLLGFVLRGLIWASFAGVTMLAAHLQAFHAQEKISRIGLKFKHVLPGGTAWAVQTMMAQMANKQQYKEMIAFGTAEYEAAKKKDQTLAPICAYLGMAHQIQGDPHTAILWNERAVDMFAKAMEPLDKAEAKTKVPNRDFVDSIIIQYASAYANLASNYFNVNNYGKAKKNFQLALEQLAKVKDSPQKEMLVRGINEHIARLKHW